MSHLETLLTELIAQHDHVRPEDVTLDYIRKQRESKVTPNLRFEVGSELGGYDGADVHFYTETELADLERKVDARWARI